MGFQVTLEQSKDDVKLLYDGQGGTLPSLAPGEHLDFHVKHDLKAVRFTPLHRHC